LHNPKLSDASVIPVLRSPHDNHVVIQQEINKYNEGNAAHGILPDGSNILGW